MNILLQTKKDIEDLIGTKSVMAHNLLGMNLRGEKAFLFSSTGMNEGYEMTVGFFEDVARYVAFKRKSSGKWTESDMRATLMQIGPWEYWSCSAGSDFYNYKEKEGDKTVASAAAWQTPKKRYAFAYSPLSPGMLALAPDKASLDKQLT